jgi:hypothetical protein
VVGFAVATISGHALASLHILAVRQPLPEWSDEALDTPVKVTLISPATNTIAIKRNEFDDRRLLAFDISASRHGANDKEWLSSIHDIVGQWQILRFVGKILLARKKADELAPLFRERIADCAQKDRITHFEGVNH